MAFNKSTFFAVLLVAAAILYQYYKPEGTPKIIYGQKSEDEKIKDSKKRIAIGLNADVDYIISAVQLLKALNIPAHTDKMTAHPVIATIHELQETVAFSMSTCSGIERHFSNSDIFDKIVETASKLNHEEYVGGNAALMAMKLSELAPDTEISLTGPIGSKLKKYIDKPNIQTNAPLTSREEIHIIMEYSKGEEWGGAQATCANRVIISHDKENSELTSLDEFESSLNSFKPGVVVFTGAHMLDGQPEELWKQKIVDIVHVLKKIPRKTVVHFELATIGNLQFMSHLVENILPHVDSLGLNEQELLSIAKSHQADFNFTEIGPKPFIPDSGDMLYWLFEKYSAMNFNNSRLSRIHFHSLTYHILVTPKDRLKGTLWENSLNAVLEGSKIASIQACQTDAIKSSLHELQVPKKFRLSNNDESLQKSVIEDHSENGYVSWLRDKTWRIEFNMSPVFVCKKPLKTVGLGDAISAAGLLTSEFSFKSKKHNL